MEDLEVDDFIMEAIISYFSGELTEEQAGVLMNWIERSVENLKYFKSIGDIWYASGALNEQAFSSSKGFDKLINQIKTRGKH